jgi:protein-tyrosine-phosphatase
MTTNVLILCTHNSARSVLAEGMLNHWAGRLGKDVRAYSAGSAPRPRQSVRAERARRGRRRNHRLPQQELGRVRAAFGAADAHRHHAV